MIGFGLGIWKVAVFGPRSTPATTPQIEILTRAEATILTRSGDTIIARS